MTEISPHPDLEEIESQDGDVYYHRPIPEDPDQEVKISLNCIDTKLEADLSEVNGFPVHHLYVSAKEIRRNGLPLEADPRRPKSSRQVTAMKNTLEDNPEDFVKFNNGIVVLCGSVDEGSTSDNTVELGFRTQEGICNGGHTYFSIYQAESVDGAAAHIEAIEIPLSEFDTKKARERKITEIAQARNNNNQLDRRSIAHFLGYFNPFKDILFDAEVVEWNEGDPNVHPDADEFNSVDFIRLLKTWDVKDHRHPLYNANASNHRTLAVSRGKILNRWADNVEDAIDNDTERPLNYMIPVVNDLMFVRDWVAYEFKEGISGGLSQTKFYTDYIKNEDKYRNVRYVDEEKKGLVLPRPLEVLFVGLFRTNLYLSTQPDKSPEFIGWFMDFEDLWNRRIKNILKDMNDTYKGLDTPKRQFKRLNGPFSQDFFKIMVGQTPRSPHIIYEIEKFANEYMGEGGVYIQEDDGKYILERNEDNPDKIVSLNDRNISFENQTRYSEISMDEALRIRRGF